MQFVLRHAPQDPGGLEAEWIFQIIESKDLFNCITACGVLWDGQEITIDSLTRPDT